MAVIVLLISLVSLIMVLGVSRRSKAGVKEILLCSALVFSIIILFITEVTSAFQILNYPSILMSWIAVATANISYLAFKKERTINFLHGTRQLGRHNLKRLSRFEKAIAIFVFILLTLIFVQGIIYPPNNWDSLTYHLTRILNWLSNQSVEHYPTHVLRELYQSPFSEFVIMHVNALNCGDYFSNSVQFIFTLFSLVAIAGIVELLGLGFKYQFLAVVLAVTIPEVILEASSTQNDIVVSLFLLSTFYFATKSLKELKLRNYFFLGLSCGLATLTKGIAYIYIAAILPIYGIVLFVKWFKTKNHRYLGYSLMVVFVMLVINANQFHRNYQLIGNVLGVDKNEMKFYSNEKMTPALLVSNIIKNAGLHTGPIKPVNQLANRAIEKLHLIAGVEINNRETNFDNLRYSVQTFPFINHEDTGPNPIHLLLILFSFVFIVAHALKNKTVLIKIGWLAAVLVLQVLLFCFYLKWQPFHSRLHLPWFLLCVPLICYAVSFKESYLKIMHKAIPFILIYAFWVVLFNYSRPFITNKHTAKISILDSRDKKYYANQVSLYKEYDPIAESINRSNNKNVGLIIQEHGFNVLEYPLFKRFYKTEMHPIHIKVSNYTRNIPQNESSIDCIVSTTLNDSVIEFNGKQFYNQSSGNKFVWLYQ